MFMRPFPIPGQGGWLGPLLNLGGTIAALYAWRKLRKNGTKTHSATSASHTTVFGDSYPFGSLKSNIGKDISLKSVAIRGDVEGLLFSSTIRQEYKNETEDTLEIIYTFPLGWGTALLGMNACIGEKKLKGQVVEKVEAETRYEKAVSEGNSAFMLQKSGQGLYTANLGNIKPGETVAVDIHCARLLNYDQGQVRLCIPTVIGERYGDEHCPGGLSTHETARVDINAKYPFSLELDLHGDISKGEVICPTHQVKMEDQLNGRHISLGSGAVLDKDFVLVMKGLKADSHAMCMPDENVWMAAASFCPMMSEVPVSPLGLKILVDCSGSMRGESIKLAQNGLQKILSLLKPDDFIAYSRFGSDVRHMSDLLLPCNHDNIIRLSAMIDSTAADMGGTEMDSALVSTFAIKQPHGDELPPVVLLITDGNVWDVNNVIQSAKKSGHRIFAIGVGCAPAESLLQNMAEQTGGACEFVTPNENMADAIVRMFHRMRSATVKNVHVNWGQKPIWQSRLPRFIHDGETVHIFALLPEKPQSGLTLSWDASGQTHTVNIDRFEETDNTDLLRLGRMRQMEETDSQKEKSGLALKYELVSDLTSVILVYEREDGEKIEGLPKIQQVPQMAAHGHGCYAESFGEGIMSLDFCSHLIAPGNPHERLRKNHFTPAEPSNHADLLLLLEKMWNRKHLHYTSMHDFALDAANDPGLKEAADFINGLAATRGIDVDAIWAAFLHWILERAGCNIDRQSLRLLRRCTISEQDLNGLENEFTNWI